MASLINGGDVFGSWAVIERSGSQNGRALWRCRCTCGNESHVTTSNLLSGTSTRCRSCASKGVQAEIQTDLTGQTIADWFVVRREGSTSSGKTLWLCRCKCNAVATVTTGDLRSGKSLRCRSCSTTQFQTVHGHARGDRPSRTFRIWSCMKNRCENPNGPHARRYHDKGVSVCDRWHDFANFLADMGECPSDKHSLDRYPNKDGNYEPGNCRWATQREQMQNVSSNRLITFQGETLCIQEAARRFNLKPHTLVCRLDAGWSVEKSLTTPVRQWKKT